MDKADNENEKDIIQNSNWKNKDKTYLFELQKFLDLTENIQDEELKKEIVAQMLKCDKKVTQLAEEIFHKLEEKNESIK